MYQYMLNAQLPILFSPLSSAFLPSFFGSARGETQNILTPSEPFRQGEKMKDEKEKRKGVSWDQFEDLVSLFFPLLFFLSYEEISQGAHFFMAYNGVNEVIR